MRVRLLAFRCLVAATVVAGLVFASTAFAQGPIKRVLIVHGGPPAFPGNAALDAALRKTLFSHSTIQVDAYSEYLENEEFAEAADTSLADSIRIKFANRQLDLVIANAAPALQFVLRYRDELFPNLPVVFAAATPPPSLLQGKVAGVTGIVREPSQIETLDLALELHPGTKRLHVVAYAPAVGGFRERVEATLATFSSRVAVTYSNEPTLAAMLAALKTLPANSLILYVRYSPVTKGRVIFPDELLPEIAEAAPVPIYSSLETNIGKGVVGGMMRSGPADAVRLGEMALRILGGYAAPEHPRRRGAGQGDIRLAAVTALGHRSGAPPARLGHSFRGPDGLGTVRLLHHGDGRGGDRATAVDRRAAAAARAAAQRRQHDPGE